MRFRSLDMRSRLTPVDPNAFPIRSYAFSRDARRPKCMLGVLKYALAQRPSIQMHFRNVEMRSVSTPVDPNAFPILSYAFSLDARRPKCILGVLKYALALRPSIQMRLRKLKCALARHLSTQSRFRYAQMRSRSTPVDPNALEQMWQTYI